MSGPRFVAPSVDGDEDRGIIQRPDGTRYLSPLWAKAFLGLVRAGDALARDLDGELQREHRISLRGFEILLFLEGFSRDGRLRMSDLADNAPLSQSRVSRLVAELEERGLVERTADPDDARGVVVSITGSGREKFRKAQDSHLRSLEERLFSRLTEREIHTLARITDKLLAEPADDGA